MDVDVALAVPFSGLHCDNERVHVRREGHRPIPSDRTRSATTLLYELAQLATQQFAGAVKDDVDQIRAGSDAPVPGFIADSGS